MKALRRNTLIACSLASIWLVTGCSNVLPTLLGAKSEHIHFEETTLTEGAVAPDVTLPLHNGKGKVSLSDFRGKPMVLIFGSYT